GAVFDGENYNSRLNLDYFLSGDHKVTGDLKVSYVLGGAIRQNRSKDVAVGGNNLVVPSLFNVSAKSGDANVPFYLGGTAGNNFDVQSRLLSAYGTVGFNYNGWLNAEFTGRNDWDSRLLEKNRSFFYPAANVSIVLSDVLAGLKNSNFIS